MAIFSVGLGVLLFAVAYLYLSKSFYAAKYQAAEIHLNQRLVDQRAALEARPQFEKHTCGYLALAAIYESFGINERNADLRFRLGVDEPATPVSADDTVGTLHPDILRVVGQDGFKFQIVYLEATTAAFEIGDHLRGNLPALVLITRRENNRLHWVVLTQFQDGATKVVDSLRPDETYSENLDSFLRDCVVSVILIQPGRDGEKSPAVEQLHRDGLEEMVKVYGRMRKRQIPVQ